MAIENLDPGLASKALDLNIYKNMVIPIQFHGNDCITATRAWTIRK